jgi:hypothetical protein
MVIWLKVAYPNVPVIVLNPPKEEIRGADYNVPQSEPEAWLEVMSSSRAALSAH